MSLGVLPTPKRKDQTSGSDAPNLGHRLSTFFQDVLSLVSGSTNIIQEVVKDFGIWKGFNAVALVHLFTAKPIITRFNFIEMELEKKSCGKLLLPAYFFRFATILILMSS